MAKPKTMVKGGNFYREKKGGGALLKIRKAGIKPKAKPAAPKLSLADRARKDPALLERAMADPGLRSKLADEQLTPAHRAARDDRIFKQDLNDPTTGLSGKSALRVGEQLVDREYRPLLDDIGRQERKVGASRDLQQQGNTDRYAAIGGIFKANAEAQGAANTTAVDASKQAQLDQLAVVDEVQRQAAERAGADSAVRGEGLDGGAGKALTEQAAQAKLRVATDGQSRTADASARGATQASFIQGLGAATAARGGEAHADIGARASNDLSELQGDRRKLRQDRDGKLTDTLMKIRGGEVERYLTERGLASGAEKAVLDAKVELAKVKSGAELAKWKANLTAQLQREGMDSREAIATADRTSRDYNAAAGRETSTANNKRTNDRLGKGKDKDAKPRFTTVQLRKNASLRDKAIDAARQAKSARTKDGDPLTQQQAFNAISAKYGPVMARVAIGAIWIPGGVNAGYARQLKEDYGLDVPGQYLQRNNDKRNG